MNSELLKNKGATNLTVNTICAKRVQTPNAKMANHEVLLHLFLGNMRELIISADFELRFVQLGCDRRHDAPYQQQADMAFLDQDSPLHQRAERRILVCDAMVSILPESG